MLIDLINKVEKISLISKISLSISMSIMLVFFLVQSLAVFKVIESNYNIVLFGYASIILFTPPFFMFIYQFLKSIDKKQDALMKEIIKKNTYLEHATRILRHDMHSGINTYIPRGLSSLKRRLSEDLIEDKKLEIPLRLLSEGLAHSQQVYRGIYEFTNLVRDNVGLKKELTSPSLSLKKYLKRTAYFDQVIIEDIPKIEINESLFCTAVDNLIRNGLKYNDSATKFVKVRMLDEATISIEDNGRGMSQEEFLKNSTPYFRNEEQKEGGTGLGISISIAILKEHGFKVYCKKLNDGSSIRIKIK
jgi:signal transduction histidine kinase